MSPLARPLLALACAALLHAACAQSGPRHCTTVSKGILDGIAIKLPVVLIKTSLGPKIDYSIPDNCQPQGLVLQGETVTVCDWIAKPDVEIIDFNTVRVSRNDLDPREPDATLQVIQYCRNP